MKNAATRLINLGFLSAAICMAIFVWVTYANFRLTLAEEKWVTNTLQSLRSLEQVMDNIQKVETGQQGYIITGNQRELNLYYNALQGLREDAASLYTLAKTDTSRAGVLLQLERLAQKNITFSDTLIRLKRERGYQAAAMLIQSGRGKSIADSITYLVYGIETEDRKILQFSNLQRLEQARKTTLFFFILSGIFFLGFGVAYFIVHKSHHRRRAYQEKVAYLSSLVSQTSETIFSTDQHFIVRSWNQAAEKMYGCSATDAIGKRVRELFTIHLEPDGLDTALQHLQENGFYKSEYEVSLRDSTRIFVEASVTALKGANGQVEGYVAVHTNIADRVELQRQSRQLNEQLEEKVAHKTIEITNIFERITDAFAALDKEGRLTYLNKRAIELMAFSPESVAGQPISKVFPGESGVQLDAIGWRAMNSQQVQREDIYVDFIHRWLDCTFYPSERGLSLFIRDITEQKILAKGYLKLSAAVSQSSASIVITNIKGDIEYVNPAFTKTTGYTVEESLGQNTNILKSGFSDPEIYRGLWQNLQMGLEWTGTFCNRKKNGELYWELATISPIVNENGVIINYVAVKENITDKIMAEEQLFKEKELSDSIINSLPGLFYLYSEDGNLIRWNKNVETVSGYPVTELKRMRLVDFFDAAEGKRVADLLQAVSNGEKMAGMEANFCTKSGEKIPYYFNLLSVIYEGSPCIIGTGIDLTDRKKAEEENRRLGLIASLTINAVILTDEKGDIQWVNKGFERITGYEFEEVIGKNPGALLQGPESDPATITYMRKCHGEQKGFKVEIINYSKWGEKYWLDIEVVPIVNEEQQVTGFLAIERDITDRKNAEAELTVLNNHLQERATELVASNSELERFAYVASHDLQEPLRMVISFMDLLKKNYQPLLDEKGHRFINFAVDGAERMKQLIMDLLEFSRVGTNKEEFVITDMNAVFKQVAGLFSKQDEEPSAIITSSGLPVITANPSQMAQLLQNLIGNAVKYRGAATPVIHVGCEEQGTHYLFSVSDNGIGIEQEHFDRIFILFQRLHLKNEYTGTGIGLTICKKIVERHGGIIWVTSKPGKGSTFFFTILKQG